MTAAPASGRPSPDAAGTSEAAGDASDRPASGPPPITAPAAWTEAIRTRRPPAFDPASVEEVVVVAAHPDDETIGAGGALRLLYTEGCRLRLVVATDGEAAYPALDGAARRELGRARRGELAMALAEQGLADVPVHWLGLPDSGLAEHSEELVAALAPLMAEADAYLAPWPDDPHPDHRAAGLAAAAAAPVTARGWSYPIWTWAWMRPDDPALPWDRARAVALDAPARALRRRAVGKFTSQVRPGPDGSPPVLAAGLLEHLDRDVDLLFREPRRTSAPVARFADLYADGNDPWDGPSWYERRKRAVVLASLPCERYERVVEPACGTGELTEALAPRCAELIASDPVPAAVRRARERVRGLDGVRVLEAALPDAVPPGPLDLAVFSEILYYLDDASLRSTVERTTAALRPGADVLLVHWRGWPAEAPRDAEATHRLVAAHPDLTTLVEHVDEEFLLHVLRRR